jgi:ParB-like chromosome segregation protein Spo0J
MSDKSPLAHCWATVLHGDEANKMRKRVANYGKGDANNLALKKATQLRTSPLEKKSKVKGGGTSKVCLPAAKVKSMSKAEKEKVIRAKKSAAAKGKYKRSSKSFVKGARRKGATLRDWFKKENWVQVGNPSKKCGEK